MSEILVVGEYSETDHLAYSKEFDPIFLKTPSEIAELDESACALVRALAVKGHAPIDAAVMDQLPALKMIANFGVGYDAIDTNEATKRGIKVTNTPDVLNDDVADIAVAMMIMQSRQMEQASQWARGGEWAKRGEYPLNRKFTGAKVGILGLGRIGREIADRLAAFKMEIHYFARAKKDTPGWQFHADPVSLAQAVDYLVVALVGGAETEKFVSAEVIDALGANGVIVNISRGTTIDEAAMIEALEQSKIAGAALDVFLNEPNIDPRFYAFENVVIQPHQGSGTVQTRQAMGQLQRDNISAFLSGEPLLTPVN